MTGQETRNKLTDYWQQSGVKKGDEFAFLTNIIHQEWTGLTVKDHKDLKQIPLIFLSAQAEKSDYEQARSVGADDYITKPFDEEELLWKIKAIIRRVPENNTESKVVINKIGNYNFDFTNQSLSIGDKTKRITEKESEILKFLFERRNQVVKREDLLKDLWGENDYFLGRSLDVFITKIRKYLKEDPNLSIENVFGVGFIFNVP